MQTLWQSPNHKNDAGSCARTLESHRSCCCSGLRTCGMVVMAMMWPGDRHWVRSEAALGLPRTTARAARLSCSIPIVGIGKNNLPLRCEPFSGSRQGHPKNLCGFYLHGPFLQQERSLQVPFMNSISVSVCVLSCPIQSQFSSEYFYNITEGTHSIITGGGGW